MIEPRALGCVLEFYQDTGSRKWGTPYLTRRFFDPVQETMRDDMLLVLAFDGRPVAGALNFIGRETLYGRYWGCVEDHPCLHFELCYYQAIDWAIATACAGRGRGAGRTQAGARLPAGRDPFAALAGRSGPSDAVARLPDRRTPRRGSRRSRC
jgi:uncharacterized protein